MTNPTPEQEQKGIDLPSLVPTLEFPKSGGAIKGIGEKFTPNPATGAGSFSVPIGVTAGRGAPQLSLSYNSGSGNGPFGMGWQMTIPQISRKTERQLPTYNDAQQEDVFMLSGAEDLIPKYFRNGSDWLPETLDRTLAGEPYLVERYLPRTEGLFARIERWTNKNTGDRHWRSVTGANVTSIYGENANSRIADPNQPQRVFSWLLCKTFDSKGNITLYEYKQEDNVAVSNQHAELRRRQKTQPQRYLKRILYGNQQHGVSEDFLFQVVLDYGEHDSDQPTINEVQPWPERPDSFSSGQAGFELRTRRLCRRVLMFHDFPAEFGLGNDPRLIQSTNLVYDENPIATQLTKLFTTAYEWDTATATYLHNDMPPIEFGYTKAELDDRQQSISEPHRRNTPQGLSGAYQFTDLHTEGLNGVLLETAEAWYYKRNLGEGQFDALKTVAEKPNWSQLADGRTQLSRLEANGQLYLSRLGSNAGYAKLDTAGNWSPFHPFSDNTNIDLDDPDLRYIDLDGDGKPELLLLRDQLLRWYPNQGEQGYGEERRAYTGTAQEEGPALVFQNDLESIFLTDMTGDGLSDIVRIRNGELCYWMNLGYGRFGEQVVFDNVPLFDQEDLFDPKKFRLGDIDGSGTTDLLYLGGHQTRYWLNQAGNSLSAATTIHSFPSTHQQSTVSLADLLGNGTACLVWSSPLPADQNNPWRYVDITGSTKPYLLVEIRNNMGAVSRMHYKPSTWFYLKDEREGHPWITKLPFPVQVVWKTEVEDLITGHRFASEYAYHHGYYDQAEREFRGFGAVEQWDEESFPQPTVDDPTGAFHKPRVCVKSWFHVGAWDQERKLLRQYAKEYWQPGVQLAESELLDATAWTAQEFQEAHRTMRGQLLRQEVYTEDDHPDRDKPYTVTESRYQIKRLQPLLDNPHAVFISVPLENLSAQYERNADDPRLAHEMTLEIDDFGNVLSSASIAYPRQFGNPQTDEDAISEQYELKIVYTENEFFNQDDKDLNWYVKGVPLSAKVYEIEQFSLSFPPFFERQALLTTLAGLPPANKKLLSAQVSYYRPDAEAFSLSPTRLPYRTVESQVLPYGTYTLVLTDDLLQAAYGDILNQSEWESYLQAEQYEPDTHAGLMGWWVRGGFAKYDPNNFFISEESIDRWGNISRVTFDSIYLLPVKVTDPLQNTITARYDYRILQPLELTDPNGNRQQVAYDGFGRVIRTAVMGKVSENKGDVLSANPRVGWDNTDTDTTVIEYQHDRFYEDGEPNYVHTYTRETHHHNLAAGAKSRWLQGRTYSDGFGRELQSKALVAPGQAYFVNNGVLDSKQSDPRWLGTGRTLYDNKGQAVKQYEPYFSTTVEYEDEDQLIHWGVSPFMHYDPLGRAVQTDMPDGTFTKVEFTPWMQRTFDANDTVLDSQWYVDKLAGSAEEQRAAAQSAHHHDTSGLTVLDVLGRPVWTVIHNQDAVNALNEKYYGRVVLDTVGNQLEVRYKLKPDATNPIEREGILAASAVYDLAGRPLKSTSNDAGTSYAFLSIDNQPVYSWLPRGQRVRMAYDNFRRPVHLWLREAGATTEILKEATTYGEDYTPAAPEIVNMRGQVWKNYDQAGIAEVVGYNFKGAPLESRRHIFADYLEEGDWTGLIDSSVSVPALDAEYFTSRITYDALGRPVQSEAPDGSLTANEYDDGGALYKVKTLAPNSTIWTEHVQQISYNEKGQRRYITYGNGAHTTYHHDPKSYRLTRLHTTRVGAPDVQDLHYTYDAVGNITDIWDKTQQTVFFNNSLVEARQTFTYDGLNRLVEATGREQIGQQAGGEQYKAPTAEGGSLPYNNPSPNDHKALQSYTQRYTYDEVGNIQRWRHLADQHGYTRTYEYYPNTNRLKRTYRGTYSSTNTTAVDYNYDAAGNITTLPQNNGTPIVWNYENQPSRMDFGPDKIAHYRYDAGGERLRKVIEKGGGKREERIYLGNYEVYREYSGTTLTKERSTLHVADDTARIALIETLTVENATPVSSPYPILRYQLANHLGTAGIELDANGAIISYEEYHPYGTTAFYWKNPGISQKRYRYIGKERDAESGLSYHSARYYLPWLGRWLSADPAGMVDGVCLYQYGLSNPVGMRDGNGMQTEGESGSKYIQPEINTQTPREIYGPDYGHKHPEINYNQPEYRKGNYKNAPVKIPSGNWAPAANASTLDEGILMFDPTGDYDGQGLNNGYYYQFDIDLAPPIPEDPPPPLEPRNYAVYVGFTEPFAKLGDSDTSPFAVFAKKKLKNKLVKKILGKDPDFNPDTGGYKVGHAGVIIIDGKSRKATYTDFGRFPGHKLGKGKGVTRIGGENVNVDLANPVYDSKGNLTNAEEIVRSLFNKGNYFKKGSTYGKSVSWAIASDVDIDKMNSYMLNHGEKVFGFLEGGSYCAKYAYDILKEGGAKIPALDVLAITTEATDHFKKGRINKGKEKMEEIKIKTIIKTIKRAYSQVNSGRFSVR